MLVHVVLDFGLILFKVDICSKSIYFMLFDVDEFIFWIDLLQDRDKLFLLEEIDHHKDGRIGCHHIFIYYFILLAPVFDKDAELCNFRVDL